MIAPTEMVELFGNFFETISLILESKILMHLGILFTVFMMLMKHLFTTISTFFWFVSNFSSKQKK